MMINLIKADLYKEFKKRSFKYFVLLIIFVSILSLVIINSNDDFSKKVLEEYLLFSEEEYYNVNKYGSYKQYVLDFNKYKELSTAENEVILKDNFTKAKYLLSYSHNFVFLVGILVVFISYHSLSYDFQNSTLRYLFMSKYDRKKILFSKIISFIILSFILLLILVVTMFLTTTLLTHENVFTLKTIIFEGGSFRSVLYIYEFFKSCLMFLVPFVFVIFLSMFLCVLFKGNSFGLILGIVLYLSSLLFTQILLNYGYNFVQYTFLPYIDFTYYVDKVNASFNNIIYNINLCYKNAFLVLGFYSTCFLYLIFKLMKRDIN